MTRALLIAAAALSAAPALAQDGGADVRALLERPRAEPPQSVNYRYVLDVEARHAEGEDADTTARASIAVDATAAPGSRTSVLSRDDATKDLTKIIDGVIEGIEDKDNTPARMSESFYCTLDAEGFSVAREDAVHAVLVPDAASMEAVMRKDGTPKRIARRLAERLDGEIVLSKPDLGITSTAFRLTEPMKVMMVAKIHDMELTQSCVPSPDGFNRSETMGMRTRVTAMGKDTRTAMTMRVRDVVPVVAGAGAAGAPGGR